MRSEGARGTEEEGGAALALCALETWIHAQHSMWIFGKRVAEGIPPCSGTERGIDAHHSMNIGRIE
jgi:hypothetical protein